jgi:hypothetical protein
MNPIENYGSLMWTIRGRFDVIEVIRQSDADPYSRAETAAFHGRKILEAIAFACLVAIDNGLKKVPKDAKGQWNAEKIFKSLKAKNITTLPSPSNFRLATEEEIQNSNVKATIEGIPERRLSHEQLIDIYQNLHAWLHEINPYIHKKREDFYKSNEAKLWINIERLHLFVERHFISIHGSAFFCILRDAQDQQTKVIPLSKEQA